MKLNLRPGYPFLAALALVFVAACEPPAEQQEDLHIRYLAAGGDAGVSEDGVLRWSKDPIQWPDPILWKPGHIIEGMTYGGGRFVFVGHAGLIRYSMDGASWVPPAVGPQTSLYAVAYGHDASASTFTPCYVTVGREAGVFRSVDGGDHWYQADLTNLTDENLYGVASGGEYFVAVGPAVEGAVGAGTQATILVSSDGGDTWVVHSYLEADATNLWDVGFGNSRFVAVGADGGIWYADIFDSQQQPIWPGAWYRADSGTTLDLTACAYGEATWVAVGTVPFYSTDNGETWTRATDVPDVVPVPLSDVIYGDDAFVAVGDKTVLYSLDGKAWQVGKAFDEDANRFWCAAYNPDAPSLSPEDIVDLR
jgi:photosystem II stability/assembly factor-like uncharacterized protein